MKQTGSIHRPAPVQREERKTIQEACVFCDIDNLVPHKGLILNESATGILLQSELNLRPNLRLYVLPLQIGELNYSNATSLEILNHPLTRSGKVVRIEKNNHAGIHFDSPKDNQTQFKRWYRDEATITTLIDPSRAIIKLSGKLSLEAGSFINSLLTKLIRGKNDLLISTAEIEHIHSTASTVIRSTFKHILDKNVPLTIISGQDETPGSILLSGLSTEQYKQLHVFKKDTSKLSVIDPTATQSLEKKVDIDRLVDAVVISHSYTALERYCHPLTNIKFKLEKCKGIQESIQTIFQCSPQFIVIDFEIQHSDELLALNKINTHSLYRTPSLILIGPNHIEQLVRTALQMNISEYLYRPCNNDEYLGALQKSIKQLPKEFMEKHLNKIRDKVS